MILEQSSIPPELYPQQAELAALELDLELEMAVNPDSQNIQIDSQIYQLKQFLESIDE